MHDEEPDTFVLQSWPEKFSGMLADIGIESIPRERGSDAIETGDYYSRYFTNTARMITNHGCLDVKNSNIDTIQIIQKG